MTTTLILEPVAATEALAERIALLPPALREIALQAAVRAIVAVEDRAAEALADAETREELDESSWDA